MRIGRAGPIDPESGKRVLTIDGATGEGGGQILRSALALSVCLSQPFRIINVRAHRARPGLRPQHLAAVRAAAEISNARVAGAVPDSQELSFAPGPVVPAEYRFAVGTAGSATLVLQTVLPALLTAAAPSRLILEGGTHNPKAPSFDFLAEAYLPLLARMGARVEARLLRPGFYPRGGGVIEADVRPAATLEPLHVHTRGPVRRIWADVLLSKLPRHIAEREMAVVRAALELSPASVALRLVDDSPGPGNAVTVFIAAQHVCEVFVAYGRRGVPAERVADEAIRAARRYLAADFPVGSYLADQLLLPMALAGGGSFVTAEPSSHVTTNRAVIERFLPVRIHCARLQTGAAWRIEIG